MQLVKRIPVRGLDGPRDLQLLLGDICNTPAKFAADALIVSAFPDDYIPTTTSLIGALHRAGVDVGSLAQKKAVDLTNTFGCWLSEELVPRPGLPFRRIVCFENARQGSAPAVVGDLFRALEPYALGPPYIKSVLMPLLASGNQGYGVEEMGTALFEASWHRLHQGHPLKAISIVVRDQKQLAKSERWFSEAVLAPAATETSGGLGALIAIGAAIGLNLQRKPATSTEAERANYDVFISYSRADTVAAQEVATLLRERGLRVFIDESDIEAGASWQTAIFEAIERCQKVVAVYSPDFIKSPVCKDEFNAAMILRRRRDEKFILPILVRDTELPAYMEMLNYVDCRVSDIQKIQSAASDFAQQLPARA